MTDGRPRPHTGDLWLAAGFVIAAAIEAVVRYWHQPIQLASNIPGSLLFAILALRRTRPLLTMTVITVVASLSSVAQALLAPTGPTNAVVPIFALFVVTYSLGAHATRRELVAGSVQPVLLILVVDLAQPSSEPLAGAVLFFTIFVDALPILAGRLVRGRTALVAVLRAQAAELAAQMSARVGAALAGERLRVATEFHAKLLTGMESLSTEIDATRRACTDGKSHDESVIAGIEESARALLAQTRLAVVSLASAEYETRDEAAETDVSRPVFERNLRTAAEPWIVLIGAGFCLGLLLEIRNLPLKVPTPVAILAGIALSVPLAMAWVRPVLMTAALWLAAALFVAVVAPLDASMSAIALSFVPPFIVTALEPRRGALIGFAVCCLGELACFGPASLGSKVAIAFCCGLAGAIFHERSRLVDELHRNNVLLDEQRAAASRQAAFEERARIARDLHDAVGHSLTVIALQAGAARRMWTNEPAKAESVLETIARVTRDGLTELRTGFDPSGVERLTATRPTSIQDLVNGARAAGLSVIAHLDDAATSLDTDARVAAYRVVQESLTNVLKHAVGATAEVTVRRVDSYVEISVVNTRGSASSTTNDGGRRGLNGMRQRVEACGGWVRWRQRADGGFEVRSQLPAALMSA